MDVITKKQLFESSNLFLNKLKKGSLFIYPTDTIYGIGCDATNESSVELVRMIKERFETPFSVIVPSKEWILRNCEVDQKFLDLLPGPVTLIVKLKDDSSIAPSVVKGLKTLGVRLPDHWVSDFVRDFGKPVVTTSVNKHGLSFMNCLEEMDLDLKGDVDFFVDEGLVHGRPSKIIDTLTNDVIERD